MKEIKETTAKTPTATTQEEKKKLPKGTERFCAVIKAYLDKRAGEDELFKAKYVAVNRPIEDIVAYIISEVQRSGVCGWTDDEVFSLAVHAAEEENLDIHRVGNTKVVVNHHIELTEEEKAEQKQLALKQFREEELAKIKARNARHATLKPARPSTLPSLFDF